MKYNLFGVLIVGSLLFSSCKKENLQLVNPNEPTPELSLKSEAGLTNFALGIIQRQLGNVVNAGVTNLKIVADVHHSIMGDETFSPYGNYGFRWADQAHKVTLPGGQVVTNPIGVPQKVSLQGFNSRQAGDRNVFQYEWAFAYFYISQANILLDALNSSDLILSGDAATKKGLLQAWALWWKGYAYSRLGSIYIAGVINNSTDGTTSSDYVTSAALITEANKILDEAAAVLTTLTGDATYNALFKAIVPSFSLPDNVVSPDMWKRQINTLKARNLLVNKKVADMTSADWTAVLNLATTGLQITDFVFHQGMTLDGNNDVTGSFFHPFVFVGTTQEFTFASERLIQDYKSGDARLDRNFYLNPSPYPANIRDRGLQFGTRWAILNVEDGGSFATNNNRGSLPMACSYEENALMRAEALIHTGNIETALQIIDAIRGFQSASLPAVAGTGLDKTHALEELRRERRVALFMRGLAFYDARRWGVIAPVSQGGGRANAVVYLPGSLIGTTGDEVRNCFIEYDYMEYFDVPLNEVDFNTPSATSAPIKN